MLACYLIQYSLLKIDFDSGNNLRNFNEFTKKNPDLTIKQLKQRLMATLKIFPKWLFLIQNKEKWTSSSNSAYLN